MLHQRIAGDDDASGRDGGNGGSSRIVGAVTTDEGEPLPGARVTVTSGGDYVDETRSDDEGRYELGGLVAGDYGVGASSLRREYEAENPQPKKRTAKKAPAKKATAKKATAKKATAKRAASKKAAPKKQA